MVPYYASVYGGIDSDPIDASSSSRSLLPSYRDQDGHHGQGDSSNRLDFNPIRGQRRQSQQEEEEEVIMMTMTPTRTTKSISIEKSEGRDAKTEADAEGEGPTRSAFHVDSDVDMLSSSIPGPASVGISTGIGISDRVDVEANVEHPGGLFITWKLDDAQGDSDTMMNTEEVTMDDADPDADADAKRKAKNREASAKSRQKKINTIIELKKQEANLEAEIKLREDSRQQQEYEAASSRYELEYGKAYFHELERYFLGQGDRGREEWGKVLASIARQQA